MPSLDELTQLDRYTRCLSEMHGFYAAWEPAIWSTAGVCEVVTDSHARRKLPWLEQDLRALNAAASVAIDIKAPSVVVSSTAEALGALYVLEGATLGGRVILRHIAVPLQLPIDAGLAFFHGYGALTGQMWSAFGQVLQRWADGGGDRDAAVAGAIRCFSAFESWLRSCDAARALAVSP